MQVDDQGLKETAAGEAENEPDQHNVDNDTPGAWRGRQPAEDKTSSILNLGNGSTEDLCMHIVGGLGCSFNS